MCFTWPFNAEVELSVFFTQVSQYNLTFSLAPELEGSRVPSTAVTHCLHSPRKRHARACVSFVARELWPRTERRVSTASGKVPNYVSWRQHYDKSFIWLPRRCVACLSVSSSWLALGTLLFAKASEYLSCCRYGYDRVKQICRVILWNDKIKLG